VGEIETKGDALTLDGNTTPRHTMIRTTNSFDLPDNNVNSESNHGLRSLF